MAELTGGVWRTINGAKVFIKNGQTAEEAIAERASTASKATRTRKTKTAGEVVADAKKAKERVAWKDSKLKSGKENGTKYADIDGYNVQLTPMKLGGYYVTVKSGFNKIDGQEVSSVKEAEAFATKTAKNYPSTIKVKDVEFKRTGAGGNVENFSGYSNGNKMTVYKNHFSNSYSFSVGEEHHGDAFVRGEKSSREAAMLEAYKASQAHKHSGIRPIIIPGSAATSMTHKKWNNDDFYRSKPKK